MRGGRLIAVGELLILFTIGLGTGHYLLGRRATIFGGRVTIFSAPLWGGLFSKKKFIEERATIF